MLKWAWEGKLRAFDDGDGDDGGALESLGHLLFGESLDQRITWLVGASQ